MLLEACEALDTHPRILGRRTSSRWEHPHISFGQQAITTPPQQSLSLHSSMQGMPLLLLWPHPKA